MRGWTRWGVTLVVAVALLAGCGDDEGGEDSRAGCGATDLTATFPDGTEVELDRAGAQSAAVGGPYTVFAADFEALDDQGNVVATPDDGHLAVLALSTFTAGGAEQPISEGSSIEWTDEPGVLTFAVTLNKGTAAFGAPAGAAGTVEVVELDEGSICVRVDYSDDEKRLVGTIDAEIPAAPVPSAPEAS